MTSSFVSTDLIEAELRRFPTSLYLFHRAMVQGIGDPVKNSATLVNQVSAENSTSSNAGSQPAVIHLEQHVQPQVVQSQVTSLGGQRIAISSPLGGTVNVITSHSGVSSTTSSSGQTSGNATFQHYLIPGVSLGSQLQNITIPAQMACMYNFKTI